MGHGTSCRRRERAMPRHDTFGADIDVIIADDIVAATSEWRVVEELKSLSHGRTTAALSACRPHHRRALRDIRATPIFSGRRRVAYFSCKCVPFTPIIYARLFPSRRTTTRNGR